MLHTCHAKNCKTPVIPRLLMCGRHWRLVPTQMKRAVYASYRPGQTNDMNPSTAWWKAADAAIVHVAIFEGHLTPKDGTEYLKGREEFYAKWEERQARLETDSAPGDPSRQSPGT